MRERREREAHARSFDRAARVYDASRPDYPADAVAWQDAEAMIILPGASTPSHMPHGPSWRTPGGALRCGIYDDQMIYDANGTTKGTTVYYGCRIDQAKATFAYPDFDHPGKGKIGGCPSGVAANSGDVPSPLCNSGQVFSSETDDTNVLNPGEGVRFGGIECVVTAADAVTCTEPAVNHGFRVSLTSYAVF